MVVYLNLGFNIGSETGGTRYAVIIENNNNQRSGTVVVIPISSIHNGKDKSSLHESEVYLGHVIPWDEECKEGYAKILQIRNVSKMRIILPKHSKNQIAYISSDKMDEIDKAIIKYLTKRLDK